MIRKRSISKRKLPIIISLFIILLILISLLFAPSLIEGMESKKLNIEVFKITNMLEQEKINLSEIKSFSKKNITTGQRKKVEKAIEKYLLELSDNCNNVISIKNDKILINALNTKTIETNTFDFSKTQEHISKQKDQLSKSKDNIDKLSKNKLDYIEENTNDKKLIELYKKILPKDKLIEKYLNIASTLLTNIDVTNEAIVYLNNNKDYWKIENNNLIFTKRNKWNEYQVIQNKIKEKITLDISAPILIKDDKGPNIEATNLTITEGENINIKGKVKCIDDVDDEVECIISGEYDTKTAGEYNIKIEATDKSNNKADKTITLKVNKKVVYKAPYYTEVIRNQNTVIVYGLDENNEYTKVIKVMPCSVGRAGQETPTGTFTTSDKYRWGALYGGVWGQYSTRIVSDILFHSVPYFSQNPGDLEWEEYNKLGSPASLGCIRMAVKDVKWIYENCPKGTTVKIYDGPLPNGISKPSAKKIDGTSPNKGWDPTDPDLNNPWNK